jgi:hypothetical protein
MTRSRQRRRRWGTRSGRPRPGIDVQKAALPTAPPRRVSGTATCCSRRHPGQVTEKGHLGERRVPGGFEGARAAVPGPGAGACRARLVAEQSLEEIRRRAIETGAIVLQQGGKHFDINSPAGPVVHIKLGTDQLAHASGDGAHADVVQGQFGEATAQADPVPGAASRSAAQQVTAHTIAQAEAGDAHGGGGGEELRRAWNTLSDAQRTNLQVDPGSGVGAGGGVRRPRTTPRRRWIRR